MKVLNAGKRRGKEACCRPIDSGWEVKYSLLYSVVSVCSSKGDICSIQVKPHSRRAIFKRVFGKENTKLVETQLRNLTNTKT
jgi:hypothetical protein